MREIKRILPAESRPIGDLKTYSPLPTRSLDQIDPFLLLNHHGPQTYPAPNQGLPFGPHPHRGMETVTFIVEGDIMHKDSGGHESTITAGGVQYMTAGRGLIHAEISSDEFKLYGGPLEILQLWLNLPASHKMTEPYYAGFQKDKVPSILLNEGKVSVNLVAGKWGNTAAAFTTPTDIQLSTIELTATGTLDYSVPRKHNILFYVIQGEVKVNGTLVKAFHLADFNNNHELIHIEAVENSLILFGHAAPFNEPVVAQGPFVMNTQQEIEEAYHDYRTGKFGQWNG